MKILINTVAKHLAVDAAQVLYTIGQGYASAIEEDEIVILASDKLAFRDYDKPPLAVHRVVTASYPVFRNYLSRKKLLTAVREADADVLLSPAFLPGAGSVKQVFVPSLTVNTFLADGADPTDKTLAMLKTAIAGTARTLVFSKAEEAFLAERFPESARKIQLLYRVSYQNKMLSYEEREKVKEKVAGGHEYFICFPSPDMQHITSILKGFSGFKKWQKSGMKLILSARDDDSRTALKALVSTYRFRDEVAIKNIHHADYRKIVAAAYTAIEPGKYETDFTLPFTALSSGVPLMIPHGSVCSEVMEDKAFLFQWQDKDDTIKVLLETFRDERKRSEIIRQSQPITGRFNSDYFYQVLRESMLKLSGIQ